jgi:branched-subunit amino acid aminotransferase/4-amino-4-deoxychorismate lyase
LAAHLEERKIMEKKYIVNLNGTLISAKEPVFTVDNRGFRYGDGLFESMRVINNNIHLFDIHFKRFSAGCDKLKLKLAKEWTKEYFYEQIKELLKEKGLGSNARVRLSFFRTKGGFYEPASSKAEFLIEAEPMKEHGYPLNEEGYALDLYNEMEKPTNLFSTFKTSNSLIYVLAAIYKKEHKLDDCFILNSKSRVIETIDSNIFLVKNGEISTPPTTEGCVAGVMREYLLSVMEANDIKYHKTPIALEDLFSAEEVFLTNSIHGVQWVKSYKVKEYDLGIAKILSDHINKNLS